MKLDCGRIVDGGKISPPFFVFNAPSDDAIVCRPSSFHQLNTFYASKPRYSQIYQPHILPFRCVVTTLGGASDSFDMY